MPFKFNEFNKNDLNKPKAKEIQQPDIKKFPNKLKPKSRRFVIPHCAGLGNKQKQLHLRQGTNIKVQSNSGIYILCITCNIILRENCKNEQVEVYETWAA